MTVSHNNEHIVTGSRDRLIIIVRLETGEIEHSTEQHTDAVTAVALTQDDALLISASADQTIIRWTFRGMQLLDIIDTLGSPVRHMIISSDDTFIIAACDDTSVQVKSLVTGSDIHRLEGHSSDVSTSAMHLHCTRISIIPGDESVHVARLDLLLRRLQQRSRLRLQFPHAPSAADANAPRVRSDRPMRVGGRLFSLHRCRGTTSDANVTSNDRLAFRTPFMC